MEKSEAYQSKAHKGEDGGHSLPALKMKNLELAEILDLEAIQSLMDNFFKLVHITMALVDLTGNVLVGTGWQDICTKFHRVHPDTCKHCVESDINLSSGVAPGDYKLYKCKNNMWDVVTPIIVEGQHVGNFFSGQFFFDDEPLNYELFRSQARKYNFNEKEYITALEKVPRLNPTAVTTSMTFFMSFASMISQLSYSNIKLAQSLGDRDVLVETLRKSEEKYRNIVETANEGIIIIDDKTTITFANHKMTDMFGYDMGEGIGRSLWDFVSDENRVIVEKNMERWTYGIIDTYELKLTRKDGSSVWVLINSKPLFDKNGEYIGVISMLTDITKRKQKEYRIRRYNHILEGINQIFSNVVQAKTEEELGEACLSVALEVTGSEFGLIIEMGSDRLLHDVAKSKLAWEQCLMYDKTGHLSLPSDYVVHGLYGSVIINEKSFFTNDPQSHPDSIGLPYGHPPIKSFLGVPLILDGKTTGSIAVANREGGYSYEQQEDLEDIAPAVMQALQRKRSEEALRLSNIYNRSLIEASLDPLVTIGHDGKITDVNDATEQVTGYSRKDLIGTDFSDYFTEPENARTGYKQVFTEGTVRDYPLEIQHKDGQITPVLYNASVYRDENGKVIGVFAAARDITAIKKAEQKIQTLANIVESSNDAIITASLDGNIASWNKGAQEIYGYLAEEVLGKNISILEPDMLRGETKRLADEIKKGKKVKNYETSRLKKDGTTINVSVNLSPIMGQSGNLVAISCIAGDITEKKIAEKLLHEKEMAEVANRTKSEFLANMSHELRTPLNSIIGFSDMLHEQAYGVLNQKQLRAAGNVSKSGKHLLNLINNILDISKIEAGKMELDYKNFELSSKLNTIRNLLSPIADRKNINIEINIDSKLTSICADEDKFVQIMYNLVDNAIKFSYEDSFVKIEARKKGELVEISVKDTGIGIKTEDQNKLFKSFSQIDSFSSRKHQGTGLGLHLVKQIVQLHGGYVWFRSNLGEGSTFAFTIPVDSKNLPKEELDENLLLERILQFR